MRSSSFLLFVSLTALLPLGGCYGTLAKRTAAFASQAAPALVATRGVYSTVAATENRRARARAALDYLHGASFRDVHLTAQFGTAEDKAERDAILDLLERYVTELGAAAGDKSLQQLQSSSADAGKAFAAAAAKYAPKLAGSNAAKPAEASTPAASTSAAASALSAAASVSPDDLTNALDILGHVLAERARARALPSILGSADPAIQTITALLRSDLATLRPVLAQDYVRLETYSDEAIQNNASAYSYPEKQAAVEALFALREEGQSSDAALGAADGALDQFAQAHHSLMLSAKGGDPATFHARLAELIREAKELSSLESDTKAAADTTPACACTKP
jgi:hypothetical protein